MKFLSTHITHNAYANNAIKVLILKWSKVLAVISSETRGDGSYDGKSLLLQWFSYLPSRNFCGVICL